MLRGFLCDSAERCARFRSRDSRGGCPHMYRAYPCMFLSGQGRFLYGFAGFEGLVAVIHFFPVDHVPPGGQILRSAVVVLEIVGVLPDIVAENRDMTLGDRVVLIWRGH